MMQKGDIGTVIILDTGEDVSLASTAEIHYKKPSGDTGTWTGTVSGDTVTYTTVDGDIDQAGKWELQAYVVLAAWSGRSSVIETTVGDQLQ